MNEFWERMLAKHVDTAQVKVVDEIVFYDVIAADFEPRLPNFVGVVDVEKGTYFISEETPAAYRPIIIAHEHRCAQRRKIGRSGYCKCALAEEVHDLPEGIDPQEYMRFRRIFFEGLVAFYAMRPETDKAFLAELTASRDYLREHFM